VGISIYDPETASYLYQYNDSKYFVPASNTKIFSCYTAMKYLGEKLPGIRYKETDKGLLLFPTGDPTLLHPDYKSNPTLDFLKKQGKPLFISTSQWKTTALGDGWSWNDYNDDYMPERSPMPVYGNVLKWKQERDLKDSLAAASIFSIPEMNWKVSFNPNSSKRFAVQRDREQNRFLITEGKEEHQTIDVPFVTNGMASALELLKDTLMSPIEITQDELPASTELVFSQPTDSMLSAMMHRSDNFYAEQTLQMVSQQQLGIFDESALINQLLKKDFKDLPQKPGWVDGSGLSRYNLFTPQDFVFVLNKMKVEFGMERIAVLFPTGGNGTLGSLYKDEMGKIYAKTGTLGGVVALSGFLKTEKGKWLVFSILVNNHRGSASAIRKSIETFVKKVREAY
jgi:D-alanyl-D-alanine carboxypeptidase/D-alanyl-D-alanine-endopeptidase (penicillin-binding protein 4)